jgi:hypothetical protein
MRIYMMFINVGLIFWLMELSIILSGTNFNQRYTGLINISHPTLKTKKTKLHGLSPRANYTDRATAACRRSDCHLVRIEGATWSA